MSNAWFRFYSAALRNPKVAKLSDRDFRLWVSLLAASSENDGRLPPADELKHMLNARLDHLLTGLQRLISAGLIDALERGYAPHNWEKFQYKSDVSTARVQKHRASRNVSETPPEQIQNRTEKIPIPASQQETAARPKVSELERLLFEAAGIAGFRDERHPRLMDMSPVYGLIDAGYDLHREILPVIRDRARNKTFSSWRFFTEAVVESAAANRAIPPKPAAPSEDWKMRLHYWHLDRTWAQSWGPKPGEPGCRVPEQFLRTAA
jgi:hypothetical protein